MSPSKNSKKKLLLNIFFFVLIAILFSINLVIISSIFSSSSPGLIYVSDFVSFLTGSSIISSESAGSIYDLETQRIAQSLIKESVPGGAILPFRSLPFLAIFFKPFLSLNIISGYKIFLLINLSLLIIFTFISGEIFTDLKKCFYWFLIPLAFFPVLHSLFLGQISLILLFIIFSLYYLLKNRKDFSSGALSALLLIKIQYLSIVPMLLMLSKNKRKFLMSFLIAFSILILINVKTVGLDAIYGYPAFLSSTEMGDFGSRPIEMFSFSSFLLTLSGGKALSLEDLLFVNFSVYVLVFWIYYKSLKRISFDFLFIFSILSSLFFGIHVLDHDLVILLIPIFILLSQFLRKKKEIYTLIVSLVLFLLPLSVFINIAHISAIILIIVAFYLIMPKAKKIDFNTLFNYLGKVK